MKAQISLSTLILMAGMTLAHAQAEPKEGNREPNEREQMRQRLMKEFDKDGDGQLNEEETQAARKARDQARKERGEGGQDARAGRGDQGGRGDQAGRGGGRDRLRQEALKRFDTDGDGELGEAERDAMRQRFEQTRDKQNAKREGAEKIRKLFDADEDGELSAEEQVMMYECIFEITSPARPGFGF